MVRQTTIVLDQKDIFKAIEDYLINKGACTKGELANFSYSTGSQVSNDTLRAVLINQRIETDDSK